MPFIGIYVQLPLKSTKSGVHGAIIRYKETCTNVEYEYLCSERSTATISIENNLTLLPASVIDARI